MQSHGRRVLHYIFGDENVFGEWLEGLKDTVGRAGILKRIDRIEEGNFGDHRSVGGGDKGTQKKDIRRAQELWAEYRRVK